MIVKHRNWAFLQMVIAILLSVLFIIVLRKAKHMNHGADDWNVLGVVLYVAAYAMWVMASFSLARAKGYHGDAMGALLTVCLILGFCIPILPILFPFYMIFGLEDKTKGRRRKG